VQRSKKQKEEEGLLRCSATNKILKKKARCIAKKKEKKKVYLYNAWVPLRLQAQFQAPAPTAPALAPSSLPINVSRGLAME
jgi:hypothetical protein